MLQISARLTRVEAFERERLSHVLSHPRPDEFDIERFTRVKPFPLDGWDARFPRLCLPDCFNVISVRVRLGIEEVVPP